MSIEESNSTGATPPPSYTNKESPLTDIATSPPPFSLPLDEDIEEELEESTKNGGNNSNDDSSELSDLGDEDSEAETDKMDFLEDEANSSLDHTSLDLHALSKLTELAQLKEIDDDLDDEDKPETVDFSLEKGDSEEEEEADGEREDDDEDDEELKKENGNGSVNGKKRTIDQADVGQWKKQKQEDIDLESIHVGVKEEDPSSKEEEDETDKPAIEKNGGLETRAATEDEDQDIADAGASKVEADGSEQADSKADTSDKGRDADEEAEGSVAALEGADADLDAADAEAEAEAEAEEEAELEAEAEAEIEDEDEDEVDDTEDTENAGKRSSKPEKEDGANSPGADSDGERDDEVDMNEQRKLAIKELVSVETDFANLRDKLYHDKLQLLEHELKLCLEGSHPELSKIYYKVNGFYQDNLKYANSNLNYKLRCIDRQTIATRTAIHQDFLKSIMDYKNEMISNTTSLWYKINKERNQMDQLVPEYNFSALPQISVPAAPNGTTGNDEDSEIAPVIPLPKKVIKQRTLVDLVQRRNDFNHEVGIQGGLLEFHGFPSAITSKLADVNVDDGAADDIEELILRKATEEEIQDDLRGMGILT